MKFLFIFEQVQDKWLNIPNSGFFMFIRCTHLFRLLLRHLCLHIITCKTGILKFSIAVDFCICALFKEY